MALLIGTHTGSTVLRKQYVGCREGGGPKMGRLVTHSCQHRDQSVHLSVPNTKSDFFFPSMIWMTLFTLMSHIYKKNTVFNDFSTRCCFSTAQNDKQLLGQQ